MTGIHLSALPGILRKVHQNVSQFGLNYLRKKTILIRVKKILRVQIYFNSHTKVS